MINHTGHTYSLTELCGENMHFTWKGGCILIDLTISNERLKRTIGRCRDRNIIIPTFSQLKNPHTSPDKIKDRLRQTGLWDVAPQNLFRITWKNEPTPKGGLFRSTPNYLELPPELTGVEARIIALIGKWFPTGSHKVGASFGCLVPPLVTGQFDPTVQKAVWPSTGNFCRGGAYDATLLGCDSIADVTGTVSMAQNSCK